MNNIEQMTLTFVTALTDVFKDEDDRELNNMPEFNIEKVKGNELVLSMFYAFQFVFNQYTGRKDDSLKFIGVLTRLLFQEQQNQFTGADQEDEGDENTSSDK